MRKFFLLAALLASLPTLADTFESGGFTYTTSGDSASLTTGANVSEVVIPQTVTNEGVTYTVTQVGTEAFYGMWKVEKVTFPNTLEILGESAFDDCSNLVSAPLPKSLQRMEGYCFYGCPLQEVEVPEGCTFIGSYNWAQCSYLKTISLPSTLLELGTGVFSGTPRLEEIKLADGNTSYQLHQGMLFSHDLSQLYVCPAAKTGEIVLPNQCSSLESCAFQDTKISSVVLTDLIKIVPSATFRDCSNLEKADLRNVTKLGQRAFANCTSMKKLVLPETLVTLSDAQIFDGMEALEEITIPEKVTGDLGKLIFRNCRNLKRVVIGPKVKSFKKDGNFKVCPSLKEIFCLAQTPYGFLGDPMFTQANFDNAVVTVPQGCLEAYRAAPYWGSFKNIVELSDQENSVEAVYIGKPKIFLKEGATIQVAIKNTGTNLVTSVDYSVAIDGHSQDYSFDDIAIQAGEQLVYKFPASAVPDGQHTISVVISKVNGADNRSPNKNLAFELEIYRPAPIPENSAIASYSTFDQEIGAAGGEKNVHIDAACLFADRALEGKKVVAMKIQGVTTQGLSKTSLWYSKECKLNDQQAFVPDGESMEVEIDNDEATVVFDTPAIMPSEGLYFGISLDNDMSGSAFPVRSFAAREKVEKGYYTHLSTSNTFVDNSYSAAYGKYGVLGVTLYLEEGTAVPGKVLLKQVSGVKPALAGQTTSLEVGYQNFTGKSIKAIECSYETEGEMHSYTVELPEPALANLLIPQTFTAPVPALETPGKHSLKMTLTKADLVVNPETGRSVTFPYYVGAFQTLHRPLLEEYTGTGCGYCPRGMMAMNIMSETYPDFIGIAYHGFNDNDPMYVDGIPVHFTRAPSAVLDRQSGEIDPCYGSGANPMDIVTDFENCKSVLAPADMGIEPIFDEADRSVTAKTTLNFSYVDGGYSLGYVLTIDSLSHPDLGAWKQSNFYEGVPDENAIVNSWGDGTYAFDTYNHVVIDCTRAKEGERLEAENLVVGKEQSYSCNFKLTENSLLDKEWLLDEDLSKINMVAFLVDDNGFVRNAVKARLGEKTDIPTGIQSVITIPNEGSSEYYDLMGRRVQTPVSGFFIKVKNGKATKVML